MYFKNSLCQVLCLVITVTLYRGATAECDSKQSTNAQLEEVIEKLASLKTNQMADSNQNLRKITDKIMASQSGVEKQLTNIKEVSYETGSRLDPSSCATLNINETGTYSIRPAGVVAPFLVLCDFEDNYKLGGGWTVFQRRIDGAVNFYRNWTMYKNGFGDVNGEHWLGLEKLHLMTRSGKQEMLVTLEDHEGRSAYALYDSFQIGSEVEKYKLTIGGYSGTAGDALSVHDEEKFSTFDQDNDAEDDYDGDDEEDDEKDDYNCAKKYNGAWWFNACYDSHLNGKYRRKGEHLDSGVAWNSWKGKKYSLKSSKMMLRRRSG